jgi:transcriptional regulator with PAS, ATPase and Fis domain
MQIKQSRLTDIYEMSQSLIRQITQDSNWDSCCIVDPEGFIVYYCLGPELGLGMRCNATTGINKSNMIDLRNGKTVEAEIFVEDSSAVINTLMAPIFDIFQQISSILMYGSLNEIPRENKIKFYLGAQLVQERYQHKQRLHVYANSIINGISDGALLIDHQLHVMEANAKSSEILGLDHFELVGCNIAELIKGESFNPAERIHQLRFNIKGRDVSCTVINQHTFSTWNNSPQFMLIFKANPEFQNNYQGHSPLDDFIGASPEIQKIKTIVKNVANKSCNVLIRGESGTGKEILAQAIHWESGRKGAFVPVNCGAIPRELLQSELFGYEDGTFTGARKGGKKGKFELAEGGTLFLDEIGEMPSDMQVSLLRVLQDKTVTRLGGSIAKKFDVRIVAATNADLEAAISDGTFREDLYFRLNVVGIETLPLRQRQEDIPLLVRHILHKLCQEHRLMLPVVQAEVLTRFEKHNWRGNVRELYNVLETMLLTSSDGRIEVGSLPACFLNKAGKADLGVNGNMEDYQKKAVLDALQSANGNISRAAKILGITRNTLYKKMYAYNIAR